MRSTSNILILLINFVIIIGAVSVLWHWLAPKENYFLTANQIKSVEMITFVTLFFNFVKDLCPNTK